MFNIGGIFAFIDEDILSKIKLWHVLLTLISVFVFTAATTASIFLYLPKYITYLELEDMRRSVLWTETHKHSALVIGPTLQKYPEYCEFVLSSNNDDLDTIVLEKD